MSSRYRPRPRRPLRHRSRPVTRVLPGRARSRGPPGLGRGRAPLRLSGRRAAGCSSPSGSRARRPSSRGMRVSTISRSRCRASRPFRPRKPSCGRAGIDAALRRRRARTGRGPTRRRCSSPTPTASGSRSTAPPARPGSPRRWPARPRAASFDGPVSRGRAGGAAPGRRRGQRGAGGSDHSPQDPGGRARVRGRAAIRHPWRRRPGRAGVGHAAAGRPGFLSVPADDRLRLNASLPPSDPLDAALAVEADLGVLLIDPPTRRRMRLNGRSRPLASGLESGDPRGVLQLPQVHPSARGVARPRSGRRRRDGRARFRAHAAPGGPAGGGRHALPRQQASLGGCGRLASRRRSRVRPRGRAGPRC